MKKALLLFCLMCLTLSADKALSIIPQPVSFSQESGQFKFNKNTRITGKDKKQIQFFSELLAPAFGRRLKISKTQMQNAIVCSIDKSLLSEHGQEAYSLKVSKKNIIIKASSEAGLFYGFQTLRQLLPSAIFKDSKSKTKWTVPAVEIVDYPNFKWRGMMLDVGRHYYSKEFIKKFIDLMALHKLNTFHWHLTEDQGWRIEIKKYPKLTETGAWRDNIGFSWGLKKEDSTHYNSKGQYGGFYTQEDIKEVVAYAKKRQVTVVPEIELPGHSMAALYAYPEFSCTGKRETVPSRGGVFPHVYCPGKEKTFKFLENILSEVVTLFPGEFVHIGGDECPKAHWKKCSDCQKRIKDNGLHNEHELQSYTIKRIEKFLNSKGKRLIGWDEILEGGLAPNAAVMSWRGMGGGIKAAQAGHDVVMSPTSHCYFDYYQSKDKGDEPRAWGGFLPYERVYSLNPIPNNIPADKQKHIIGVQANLWTEFMPNGPHVEFMSFPRAAALAEVAWSPQSSRDIDSFTKRLNKMYQRYEALQVNYRRPTPPREVVANWTASDVSTDWQTKEYKLKATVLKKLKGFAFQYQKGRNRLDIKSVQLLIDGKVVSQKKHLGFTGSANSNNFYELKIPKGIKAKKSCVLRVVIKAEGGNDSFGDIQLLKTK